MGINHEILEALELAHAQRLKTVALLALPHHQVGTGFTQVEKGSEAIFTTFLDPCPALYDLRSHPPAGEIRVPRDSQDPLFPQGRKRARGSSSQR